MRRRSSTRERREQLARRRCAIAARAGALAAAACLALAAPGTVKAQDHPHGPAPTAEPGSPAERAHAVHGVPRPLGISPAREGSGTSWLPDASPMHMLEMRAGEWSLGLMGNVFLQWIDERGPRGDDQFGSVNWLMGMAHRALGGGTVRGHAMFSLEPATVGRCGYPDLLATGELCRGERLHDRQHPHDLFMELSAAYAHAVSDLVGVEVYGAVAGEPALGPTAYPHRPSAMPSPIAPISHHWLDSTHISFGVVTAGVHGRRWKLEGSAFNGREPDETRYDVDLAALDSFSGRIWVLPDAHWALQASAGRLREAEERPGGGPRADVDRVTASATFALPFGDRSNWTATAAWGRNSEEGDATNAILVESALALRDRDVFFARIEAAQKTGEDLVLPPPAEDVERWLGKMAVTYVRQFEARFGSSGVLLGVGAGASLSRVPAALEDAYGGNWPYGFVLFLNARPAPMRMEATSPGAMPGMGPHAM